MRRRAEDGSEAPPRGGDERVGVGDDRAEIEMRAGGVLKVRGDLSDLLAGVARSERQDAGVCEFPDRPHADAGIRREDPGVGLVERVEVRVPPPRVGRAAGPRTKVRVVLRQERIDRKRRDAVRQK